MKNRSFHPRRAFTLVEVLAALLLVSIALPVAMKGVSTCSNLASSARRRAEAGGLAEMLHARLRTQWGFPDPPGLTMEDRLKARYRGLRVSFGYPACPRLEDQQQLFAVLKPEDIGVSLTEGCMMEPEASVSALVFHHPDAFYFSVT